MTPQPKKQVRTRNMPLRCSAGAAVLQPVLRAGGEQSGKEYAQRAAAAIRNARMHTRGLRDALKK